MFKEILFITVNSNRFLKILGVRKLIESREKNEVSLFCIHYHPASMVLMKADSGVQVRVWE